MIEKLEKLKSDTRFAMFQVLQDKKDPAIASIRQLIKDIEAIIDDPSVSSRY